MPSHGQQQAKLIDTRHPVWELMHKRWEKWRLCYEGGDPFKEAFLERYSKREPAEEFNVRKKLTYVPGHASSVINIVRNALAVKLPEVVRVGDPRYQTAMRTNVDTFRSSMTSFMALEVVPLLLAQGRRYVSLDAPALFNEEVPSTLAEDQTLPYVWALNAEEVLSWAYDEYGRINAALVCLWTDVTNDTTGLTGAAKRVFRYMRYLEEGQTFSYKDVQATGPGVLIVDFNKDEKLCANPKVYPLSRVPLVEFSLVQALMSGIADHQITALNLASTDCDFLWKGNFPLYTEQVDVEAVIKPRGSKARAADETTGSMEQVATTSLEREAQIGTTKGRTYKSGMDRPDFIAPGVENLKVSMEKQQAIAIEIRSLMDLALASLSVKAVEQSGKAKEADRIGEEAGLAYIGQVLETGEREIASVFHELLGVTAEFSIAYPSGYSVKSAEERLAEAEKLRELRSATRSPQYQALVDERIAEIMLRPLTSEEQLEGVLDEIRGAEPFDDDKQRAKVVQDDVIAGYLSPEKAATLRGYGPEEAEAAAAARLAQIDAIAGGEPQPGMGGE